MHSSSYNLTGILNFMIPLTRIGFPKVEQHGDLMARRAIFVQHITAKWQSLDSDRWCFRMATN